MDWMDVQYKTREGRISYVEQEWVPMLDSDRWGDIYPVEEGEKEAAGRIIAEELHDFGEPLIWAGILSLILLFTLDALLYLNAQAYGLFVNIWATLAFIFPAMKGRGMIATVVSGESKAAKRRLEVQSLVANSTGICLFGIGFLAQLMAVQLIPQEELLTSNLATPPLPQWTSIVALLVVFHLTGKFVSWRRSKHLDERFEDLTDPE